MEQTMEQKYPVRSESHNLEALSERFFAVCLPKNWVAEKPAHDYGVDLRVDIFEGDKATGLELLVQLKSSHDPTEGGSEFVDRPVATYNHLWGKLQVAMLVKFVEASNEAYWLLMKDIPSPKQSLETFRVHIPKKNTLSTINWAEIEEYVREVTDDKLVARRAQLQRRHRLQRHE